MSGRWGFGLVELIVALTILSITLLGLAGAAAIAHRAFTGAEAAERGADVAAIVLDSLLRESAPASGERRDAGAVVRWTVLDDGTARRIDVEVDAVAGSGSRRLTFHALHHVH